MNRLNKKINAQNRTITLVYGGSKLTDTTLINNYKINLKSFGFNSRGKLGSKTRLCYLNDEKKDNNFEMLSEKDANIIQLQNVT